MNQSADVTHPPHKGTISKLPHLNDKLLIFRVRLLSGRLFTTVEFALTSIGGGSLSLLSLPPVSWANTA